MNLGENTKDLALDKEDIDEIQDRIEKINEYKQKFGDIFNKDF